MVLGQILKLHDAPREPPGAVGSVELEHPTGAAVLTDGVLHGLILLDGGFRQLLPKGQNIGQGRLGGLEQGCHGLLVEGIHIKPTGREPILHLRHAVGIVQPGQSLQFDSQRILGYLVKIDGVLHQRHIQADATVVYLLVDVVFVPDEIRHGVFGKAVLYGHLNLHVPAIVCLEGFPLLAFRLVERGSGEVADESLALGHLLFLKTEDAAHGGK